MSDQGDTAKKPRQQSQTQQISSSSPHLEESSDNQPRPPIHHHHHQPQQSATTPSVVGVSVASPYINPTPLYVSPSAATASSSPFETATNPKRTRYATGQWKLLPSSSIPPLLPPESSPQQQTQQPRTSAASSSDTASSDPTHSPPVPSSLSPAAGPEGNKSEGEQQIHHQFRKGKYVSPVWKPHEMLWLARAWRVQYQGGGGGGGGGAELGGSASSRTEQVESGGGQATRGKTRADKDREVAEFLQRHGVNRDAKTAGTKWDNMLGEFRKVYEWERGGERQHVGKSYFRLSPYERKVHRLPASFDEEVFEELSQFMGSRMRTSHTRGGAAAGGDDSRSRALPAPPPFKEDELPLSGKNK